MKLIVAGGRDYRLTDTDLARIAALPITITEIVTGACRGVDQDAEQWARSIKLPVKRFPADWDKYGKAAGPRRNAQMAKYADACVLFPGNLGTESMRQCALREGLQLFIFPSSR